MPRPTQTQEALGVDVGVARLAFHAAADVAPLIGRVTASAAVRTSVHVHTTRGVQLTPDTLLGYERSGFAVTRALLPPSRVHELRPTLVKALEERRHAALKQKVRVLIGEGEADADAETLDARLRRLPEGSVPFLQCFNVHRHYAPVAELARSLAPTAAQLLGSARVRLYQDSLFQKRPGDGPTRWHADLAMAPLDTNDFVTCWLPLQPVPCEEDGGSALVFAAGSHRDVALPFWHGDRARSARYSEGGALTSLLLDAEARGRATGLMDARPE